MLATRRSLQAHGVRLLLIVLALSALALGFRSVSAIWQAVDGRGDDRYVRLMLLGGAVPPACAAEPDSDACSVAVAGQWMARLDALPDASRAQDFIEPTSFFPWLAAAASDPAGWPPHPVTFWWLDADARARLAKQIDAAHAELTAQSGVDGGGNSKRLVLLARLQRASTEAMRMQALLRPDPSLHLPLLFWLYAVLVGAALTTGTMVAYLARPAATPMAVSLAVWSVFWASWSLLDPMIALPTWLTEALSPSAVVIVAAAAAALAGGTLGMLGSARRWGFSGGLVLDSARRRDLLIAPMLVLVFGASLLALLDLSTGFRGKALMLPVEQFRAIVACLAIATLMPVLRYPMSALLRWPQGNEIRQWGFVLLLLAASAALAGGIFDPKSQAHLWAEWIKFAAVLLTALHLAPVARAESRGLDRHDLRLVVSFAALAGMSLMRHDFAPVLILMFLAGPLLIARVAAKDLTLTPPSRRSLLWAGALVLTAASAALVSQRAGNVAAVLTVLLPAMLVVATGIGLRLQRGPYQPTVLNNGDIPAGLQLLGLFHLLVHAFVALYLTVPDWFASTQHLVARIEQLQVPALAANSDLWRIERFLDGAGTWGYGPGRAPWCGHESLVHGSDSQAAARACAVSLPDELSTDYGWTMVAGQFGPVGALALFAATAALLALLATHIRVPQGEAELVRRDVLAERLLAGLVLAACTVSGLQLVLTALGNLRLTPLTGVYWPFYSFGRASLLLLGGVLGLAMWRSREAAR